MVIVETPPGFQGLREDLPLTMYERNLPHWRQEGATYFVTFRLGDSVPAHQQEELRVMKNDWLQDNLPPHDKGQKEELSRLLTSKQENWLDAGYGSCVLASIQGQELTRRALQFFDDERYELVSYVVMPNHGHCIVRPHSGWSLERTIQSWKRRVSRELGKFDEQHSGSIWFEESFDRIIRDGHHLWECVNYIGRNPTKVRLSSKQYELWLRPSWEKRGWRFPE
jgi:putative transposase